MICPYCNKEAEWVENKEIYGKNYGKSFMIWLCKPCDAYCGCHNNTKKPLGTMANVEIRNWRKKTHFVFDKLWKGRRRKFRDIAYKRISKDFGHEVHIAEAGVQKCKDIILWVTKMNETRTQG